MKLARQAKFCWSSRIINTYENKLAKQIITGESKISSQVAFTLSSQLDFQIQYIQILSAKKLQTTLVLAFSFFFRSLGNKATSKQVLHEYTCIQHTRLELRTHSRCLRNENYMKLNQIRQPQSKQLMFCKHNKIIYSNASKKGRRMDFTSFLSAG